MGFFIHESSDTGSIKALNVFFCLYNEHVFDLEVGLNGVRLKSIKRYQTYTHRLDIFG